MAKINNKAVKTIAKLMEEGFATEKEILAMGIDELSVSPAAVLPIRAAIRQSIAKTCTLEKLEC